MALPSLSPNPADTTPQLATIVSARGLYKHYGNFTAVAGIDFDVYNGEFFGMLGPNGAGKTTTMRMIYRVTPLSAGDLTILDYPAGAYDREIKAGLGVVPQLDNLDEELNVLDNLLMYARFHDIPHGQARERALQLLDFLELSAKKHAAVRQLSGGMKRRLTLARGLMNNPRLIILDEPTTGLDPQVRITLWDKLDELRAQGVTIIMTTHYMDEAERLCERLVVMDQGKIVAQGSPRQLVEAHASAEVIEARLSSRELEHTSTQLQSLGINTHRAGERLSLFVDNGRETLQRLRAQDVPLPNAFIRPGNLEDVFLNLTGRSLRE